jgi:PKD repeat protein
MKKKYLLLVTFLSLFWGLGGFSQQIVKDTTTRRSNIVYEKVGNKVTFKAANPILTQIAGAPKANYTHFWEFGDGSYSKEAAPQKTYKKKGNYKVHLSVTNNYDNGKPPKTRPKTVAVNDDAEEPTQEIASIELEEGFKLFSNREPSPEEEMVVVVSYQNLLDHVSSGKLYLFYNEKQFKNNNFELVETRTHFGEREVMEPTFAVANDNDNSTTYLASESTIFVKYPVNFDENNLDLELAQSKLEFNDVKILEFDNQNSKEARNLFLNFKTTPEMLKDTSATVRIRGIYVSDRNYKNYKKRTLEMEIVTSHDPNKMSSNGSFINYRFVRNKKLKFKTRFQNDGEGPARTIRLETDVPDMFDKKTLEIIDLYPKCPICPKNESVTYSCLDTIVKQKQIHFTFKNIYLPGSSQKNITEKDSTKGFVQYVLKFGKDFHKVKTRSKTSIFFDKNEPVITNYATTRFLPGISIGAKAGYNYYSGLNNAKSYFVAATVSPYKSYRWYWQVELQAGTKSFEGEKITTTISEPLTANNVDVVKYNRSNLTSSFDRKNIEIPALMRYNINNYVGLGAGFQVNMDFSGKETQAGTTEVGKLNRGRKETEPIYEPAVAVSETFTEKSKVYYGGLLDITAGFARIGPSVGARYVMNFEKNLNYWQLYAIWKF